MLEGCREDGRRQGRMRVVLAEKPSVARELASFLGATQRHDGYYESRGTRSPGLWATWSPSRSHRATNRP